MATAGKLATVAAAVEAAMHVAEAGQFDVVAAP